MSRYCLERTIDYSLYKQVKDNCNSFISSKIPTKGFWEIAYGFDRACGYFIQFFPGNELAEDCIIYINRGIDEECINLDSMFDKLSGVELGFILRLLQADKNHVDMCCMDLEF